MVFRLYPSNAFARAEGAFFQVYPTLCCQFALNRGSVSDADANEWDLVLASGWDLFLKLSFILFLHDLENAAAGDDKDQLVEAFLGDIDCLVALCLDEVCRSSVEFAEALGFVPDSWLNC